MPMFVEHMIFQFISIRVLLIALQALVLFRHVMPSGHVTIEVGRPGNGLEADGASITVVSVDKIRILSVDKIRIQLRGNRRRRGLVRPTLRKAFAPRWADGAGNPHVRWGLQEKPTRTSHKQNARTILDIGG